jgi:simple sugar transport system permease protein
MRLELHKRHPLPLWGQILLPVGAVVSALLLAAVFILFTGSNPFVAYWHMFKGALGGRFFFFEVLLKMTPLCLTGLAVTVAFRAKFWNIGSEGQLFAGAVVAAWLGTWKCLTISPFVHVPVIILAAFCAGGLLAMFPAWLKIRFKVDDVVTTLMLTYVAIFLTEALLDSVWRDAASGWPHSPTIQATAHYIRLMGRYRFHLGFFVAILAAIGCEVLLKRTGLGFRIRSIGHNPVASEFAGINVQRTMLVTAFISGGLAGLAGMGEVCGVQFYLVEGISENYGFYGVAIAMLANLQPLGVILASFFFAIIINGAESMSLNTQIPEYITEVLQGLLLISMMVALLFNRYKVRIRL